ncbi:MAG: fumarate reductase/succinate dehydrogenase flavoprotein subunit [Planctomycetes bacterium]|nr:fumarate reductase/succinate dehydrogenase flavoprotein subunit [Planctomycetota bacterium]
MDKYETHELDVLIIGAGGAGLRAAIESSAMGAKTAIVCKSLLGKAHTVMAEGGAAAALGHVDPQDNWQTHFKDTMKGGQMVNHWRMAQLHAQEAPDRVRELEQWGAVFDRTPDGRILQRPFGGHTYRRLAHVGDRTGLEMIRTLQDRGVHQGIEVFQECTVTKLLKDGDRVTGAFAYWRESGRFVVFKAKTIVLATGGIGRAWQITSNSWEYTGDGQTMAYDAGAELLDMEFVQFHPTGMVWPPGVMGLLVTEAVRAEGGILRNSKGERFMWKYLPESKRAEFAKNEDEATEWLREHMAGRTPDFNKRPPELSTRDNVARSIYTEVKEGRGSPHCGVFLDVSYLPPDHVIKKLPSMYHQFKDLADVDITKEPMEIGPTCHYMMGGVAVDPETQATTVPGLFAAGEVAVGLHGANRLGGNSLSDLLVFGRRAGAGAAEHAKKAPAPVVHDDQIEAPAKEALAPFQGTGEDPHVIHRDLRPQMQTLVGIFREEKELLQALEKIREFRARAANAKADGTRMYNPGWHLALDLRNMLAVCEMVTRSALDRKESRGAHSRLDFPKTDPAHAGHNTRVLRKGEEMVVDRKPLPPMPEELKKLFEEKK